MMLVLLLRVIVLSGLFAHCSTRGTATVTRLVIVSITTGMSSGCGNVVLMTAIVGGKESARNWSRNQREDACCALAFDGCSL